jgi:hypothetical protein
MSIPNTPLKIKQTGDTHMPDVESDLDIEEATSSFARLAQPRDQGGRPAVRHAGVLLAPEDDTDLDVTADARDADTTRRSTSRGSDARRDMSDETAGRGSRRAQGMPQAQPQRIAGSAQSSVASRSPATVWIAALAAAVLLVRLLR